MSSRLDIARSYHALGFNVIPVKGKADDHKWGRWGVERQTVEQMEGLAWPDPGVTGIAAISGPALKSLAVIDLDEAPGDAVLESALGQLGLPREYPWAIRTPGKGGGWHIWISCPGLWEALEKAGKPIKAVLTASFPGADHAELRWNTCYTLLPPSAHPDGGQYKHRNGAPTEFPLEVPPQRVVRLAPWSEKTRVVKPKPEGDWTAYIAKALQNEAAELASASVGERNNQLNTSAYSMGRMEFMGAVREEVEKVLSDAALKGGLKLSEVRATFDSGWTSGTADPREPPARQERIIATAPAEIAPVPCPTYVTLRAALEALEEHTVKPLSAGIEFPWPEVNDLARAMRPGWLAYLAGYTSHGKTAAAIEIAINAGDQGNRVLFVSGEMQPEEIAVRAAQRQGLSSRRLYGGCPTAEDRTAVQGAAAIPASGNIAIVYTRSLKNIEAAVAGYQPDLLIVDYLQYLQIGRETRLEGTTRNSQGLKDLAQRYTIPVLCLSQLRRPDRTMREEEPRLDDLRDSGSIEQDGDQVMFVWRKEIEYDQGGWPTFRGKFIIAKARMGELGKLWYKFDPVQQRFSIDRDRKDKT